MEMTLEQAEKEFVLRRKHGKIHIKKYIGSGEKVVIPRYIGGLPVTKIDSWAFSAMTYDLDVNEIVIPDTVRYIGSAAFDFCKEHPGVDSLHSPCMTPYTLPMLWLAEVKAPGIDLPDDELWQVHEQ
jgi:hypothetical protein